jgi:CIC family chloride channel protein
VGGSLLSLLIFLFPSLFGEGYNSINLLLNGSGEDDWAQILNNSLFAGHVTMLIPYIALVLLTKVFATSATNGGGGCGGTFAPSLFIGCFSGFLFSRLWNIYEIGVYLPEKNFALMGMAGVMSGVMHAPLTGAFLIAELTGGYGMFLGLMITSTIAYITILFFEPHSLYAMRLAKKGELLTHHKDKNILTLLKTENVIETDLQTLRPNMYLGDVIKAISKSNRNIFPVLDSKGRMV